MLIGHYNFIRQNDSQNRSKIILFWSIIQAIADFITIIILFPTIYSIFNSDKAESIIKYFRYVGLELNSENVNLTLLIILSIYIIIKNFISILSSFIISKNAFKISLEIIGSQIKAYSSLRYEDLIKRSNDIIAKDVIAIPIDFSNKLLIPLFQLISELVVMTLIATSILLINPQVIILVTLILGPFLYLTMKKLNSKIQSIGKDVDDLRPYNFKTIYSFFNGFLDVLVANKRSYFANENIQINKELMRKYTQLQVIKNIPARVMETGIIVGLLILYYLSTKLSFEYNEVILLFAIASFRLIPSLNKISSSLLSLKEGNYIYSRIMKEDDSPRKEENLKNIKEINSISLKNVEFNFVQNQKLLENVNILIDREKSIGIFGESGSGKSTIVKLLLGLFEIQKGEILINDINLNDINKKSFYNQIGYVHQDFFILNKSIAENIGIGYQPEEIDEKLIWECLDLVKLKNLVSNMPDGIYTKICDNGSNFSGGQRQRIVIARALYKKANLIILDEATSSLDTENSKNIINLVQGLRINEKRLTSIIISHKTKELDKCDTLYNISNGTATKLKKS